MKKYLLLLLIGINTIAFAKNKEKLEFQCTLKNKSIVTVHSTQSDYIYRHIKNGKIKLEITQNKRTVEKKGQENGVGPMGQTSNLYFTNGGYGYLVFSGWSDIYKDNDDTVDETEFFDGVDVDSQDELFNQHTYCIKVKKSLSL